MHKDAVVVVAGLRHLGLPLAVEFGMKYPPGGVYLDVKSSAGLGRTGRRAVAALSPSRHTEHPA